MNLVFRVNRRCLVQLLTELILGASKDRAMFEKILIESDFICRLFTAEHVQAFDRKMDGEPRWGSPKLKNSSFKYKWLGNLIIICWYGLYGRNEMEF